MGDRCLCLIGRLIVVAALLLVTGCTNTLTDLQAVDYLDHGYYDQAIAEFNKVIQHDPDYAAAYYNRGTAYMNKDEYDLALADYNKAIELRPNYWQAYANRGTIYFRMKDYDKAIADLTRSLEINPNESITYHNRAHAYYDMKQYEKAWDDVLMAQRLGAKMEPDFLYELRKATGRDL